MKDLPGTSFNLEPAAHIRNICILRLVVAALTFSAVIWAIVVNAPFESTTNILIILFIQLVISAVSLVLNAKGILISEQQVFLQLLFDVFFISLYVYSTGGATNPFVTYLLVPISIASATLTQRYSLAITSITILLYTLLLFFYQPFAFYDQQQPTSISSSSQAPIGEHSHHGAMPSHNLSNEPNINSALDPHYVGMWINFLISALLITWFIIHMAKAIRRQEQAINQQHEQQIYDEQILSVATIAAGTAHELGTPINSLALLIDEFTNSGKPFNTQQLDDLHLMQAQIEQCRKSLRKLVGTAQQTQAGQSEVISCMQLINDCLNEWQPLRPEVNIEKLYLKQITQVNVFCDHSIAQAIINLLNNGANVSPKYVSIDFQYTADTVKFIISDQGKGVPASILEQYGHQPINNGQQKNSLGLGLFVSHASIRRHHGRLLLRNRYDSQHMKIGAEAIIELPRANKNSGEYV